MRVAVLTGGGDVPGLNPCIKAIVNGLGREGHDVIGIRRGWAGLLELDRDDPSSRTKHSLTLNRAVVRTIDRSGGTFLHTSRTNPANVAHHHVPDFLKRTIEYTRHQGDAPIDFTPHVLKNLEYLGIDRVIVIGGDDTLAYGERLHREGFPVVAVPKTMDNDVYGTDFCIGFGTAVTRSVEFIHQLRTSTGSHERIAVIELFGRHSGETALISSLLADVDRSLISEVPINLSRLVELVMRDKRENSSNYAMVTVSEGAGLDDESLAEVGLGESSPQRKLGGIGQVIGEELKRRTGEGIVYQQIGYLMRSGAPDALDLMVSLNFGTLAVELICRGESGRMCALREGRYTHVPLSETQQGVRRVNVEEMYDPREYRPKVRNLEGKPMFLY